MGQPKSCNYFSTEGSEVDAKTWDNWTPLMEAVENAHEPAVELLLKWGADPANCSIEGSTPLSIAEDKSRSSTVRKLLKDALKISIFDIG